MSEESYIVACWNCTGDFDAVTAVWCSDDPKNPTKLCPFCLHCFCDASDEYKKAFWRNAPPRLLEEVQALSRSKDRLGDILVRMKKLTIPQLLEVLIEQKHSDRKLGEMLVERGLVSQEDVESALKAQGVNVLKDTRGVAYSARPVWDQSTPDAVIQYILSLAARRGASDVHIEPEEESISVRFVIDGFSFRVDPIPKPVQPQLTARLYEMFQLDAREANGPQRNRITTTINDIEFDLVIQTLPTAYGVSAIVKIIDRAKFIKDFTTLGLEIEDRVHLMESLHAPFGLILVSAPSLNGAATTGYSIMSYLARAQRDVVSLESPLYWPMEGVRQMNIETRAMEQALRSAIAVRPEVIMLSMIPDAATARLVVQLATSLLFVALLPAQSVGQAVTALQSMNVPLELLADSLTTVTGQRLVRRVCAICRVEVEPPPGPTLALHGIDAITAQGLRFFRGKGCPKCNKVGYRGRRAVFEIMAATPEIRGAILKGLSAVEIETLAVREGMTPLRERCLNLVREGVTSFEEFARLRLQE
ncbi:MAG: Flp pilus assembly complex ATPase component TadA [Vicinamibacteria bacterium]|nr:Flp pilus assembly complex ATPase component TadA [Vicinamibacteria bacterium]